MSEVIKIKKEPPKKLFTLVCKHLPQKTYETFQEAKDNKQDCCELYVYSIEGRWSDGEEHPAPPSGEAGPSGFKTKKAADDILAEYSKLYSMVDNGNLFFAATEYQDAYDKLQDKIAALEKENARLKPLAEKYEAALARAKEINESPLRTYDAHLKEHDDGK